MLPLYGVMPWGIFSCVLVSNVAWHLETAIQGISFYTFVAGKSDHSLYYADQLCPCAFL